MPCNQTLTRFAVQIIKPPVLFAAWERVKPKVSNEFWDFNEVEFLCFVVGNYYYDERQKQAALRIAASTLGISEAQAIDNYRRLTRSTDHCRSSYFRQVISTARKMLGQKVVE